MFTTRTMSNKRVNQHTRQTYKPGSEEIPTIRPATESCLYCDYIVTNMTSYCPRRWSGDKQRDVHKTPPG